MPRRFFSLQEALEKVTESEDFEEIVELPPATVDLISDEEEVCEDGRPNDVPGEIEILSEGETVSEPASKRKKRNMKWCPESDATFVRFESFSPNQNLERILTELGDVDELSIFCDFIMKEIFELMSTQSNIYAGQKNKAFTSTSSDCKVFVGILLLSGYRKQPRQEMFWSSDGDVGCDLVKDAMTKNRFLDLKASLHLNDNSCIPENCQDKMYKIRPLLEKMNSNFQQFGVFEENVSIDEKIVQYFGRNALKQFIRGKPIRFGFKQWALCFSRSGYCYKFDIYQGATSEKCDLPLGARVVKDLLTDVPKGICVYFDNFFSSFSLFDLLVSAGFKFVCTMRLNRIPPNPFSCDKEMKKMQRGGYEAKFESNAKVLIVRWHDNSIVNVASNCIGVTPLDFSVRRSKKQTVRVTTPHVIKQYNAHMGGVDHDDWFVEKYRINIHGKKWYWPLITHSIDVALVNAWILFNLSHGTTLDLLTFRRRVTVGLLNHRENVTARKRKYNRSSWSLASSTGHVISRTDNGKQRRCVVCQKTVRKECSTCNVGLHIECFSFYHN